MTKDYSIVPALPSDVNEIVEIERASFSYPWTEGMIRQEIEAAAVDFYTAKDDARILGYTSGQQIADEYYINNIAVRMECRGRGVGSALLQRLIDKARMSGCAFISLEVRVSNGPARSLYEAFGFHKLGERADYYANPRENALIYTLFFDTAEKTDEYPCN